MGKAAKNWVIVSSDHEVQSAARVHMAQSIRSEEFVKQIRIAFSTSTQTGASDSKLSAQEVEEWINLFSKKKE